MLVLKNLVTGYSVAVSVCQSLCFIENLCVIFGLIYVFYIGKKW